jgi:hypothetical protein
MKPWFDTKTGVIAIDDDVTAADSYRQAMADGIVDPEEIEAHSRRLLELLRELDDRLEGDLKDKVREALVELAVLYALERVYENQQHYGTEAVSQP